MIGTTVAYPRQPTTQIFPIDPLPQIRLATDSVSQNIFETLQSNIRFSGASSTLIAPTLIIGTFFDLPFVTPTLIIGTFFDLPFVPPTLIIGTFFDLPFVPPTLIIGTFYDRTPVCGSLTKVSFRKFKNWRFSRQRLQLSLCLGFWTHFRSVGFAGDPALRSFLFTTHRTIF